MSRIIVELEKDELRQLIEEAVSNNSTSPFSRHFEIIKSNYRFHGNEQLLRKFSFTKTVNMKHLLLLICSCSTHLLLMAQPICSNSITGSNPGLVNPYTTGQIVTSEVTVSGIGRSPGISGATGDDLYNSFLWSTNGTIDLADYIYFTITPKEGYKINFGSLNYNAQRSNTGPVSFALRSSLDGYTNNIANPAATGGIIDLTALQNITGPITFRLYGYGAIDDLGAFGVSDFQFNGITVLPVTFGEIAAMQRNGKLKINWQTVSETQNDHFEIEASGDGRSFKILDNVRSKALAGNSNSLLSYEKEYDLSYFSFSMFGILSIGFFLLIIPVKKQKPGLCILIPILIFLASCKKGPLYYNNHEQRIFIRIAQVDKDGLKRYSKVVRSTSD